VEDASPVSEKEAAAVVATCAHGPAVAGLRSTRKPVSLPELSDHVRSIPLEDAAVADRLLGAAGGGTGVAVGVGVAVGGTAVGVGGGVAVGGTAVGVGVAVAGTDVGVAVGV
jgi:hypothetical protein